MHTHMYTHTHTHTHAHAHAHTHTHTHTHTQLTILPSNVLLGVLLPEEVVIVVVTHEREHDVLVDGLVDHKRKHM